MKISQNCNYFTWKFFYFTSFLHGARWTK